MSGTGPRRPGSPPPASLAKAVESLSKIFLKVCEPGMKIGRDKAQCFPKCGQSEIDTLQAIHAAFKDLAATANLHLKRNQAPILFAAIEQYLSDMRKKIDTVHDTSSTNYIFGLAELTEASVFVRAFNTTRLLLTTPKAWEPAVSTNEETWDQYIRRLIAAGDYDTVYSTLEGILKLILDDLTPALTADVGGRRIARTPTPVGGDGGAVELHDDDNPDDPAPDPDTEPQLRGSKQALHGVKKAHRAAVISNANTMRDLFDAKTYRQFNKTQDSREAKRKWRNSQERLNQWYGYRTTEADAQYSVDSGNVVCTVQHTIGNDSTRDQLFTVTPRNDINKRVVLNCHAEAVIEPGLTTGYMDLHQEGVYSTLQQSRYLITDALREMCSDPKFDGKPAIVFRVNLTNDSSTVIPKRYKAPSTDDDAIRLISLAVLAFNADPRVVVKLLPDEYNFLVGKRTNPAVAQFLAFYEAHDLHTKTNTLPIHKFTPAEVGALRAQYKATYVDRDVLANKIR